jgi:hypothetical protein
MKASAISERQNPGPADFIRNRPARLIDMLRVGGLLAFGLTLWMANLLPIQKGILICESNAVVSETRWSHLVELSSRRELDSVSIRWVSSSHTPARMGTSGRSNSSSSDSLRHLKLRMGLHAKLTAIELQQEINRLTTPRSLDSAVNPQPKLHRERWQVQVAQHALSRFRLDCERRGVAVTETTGASPFRLASNTFDPTESEDRAVMEKLTQSLADAERALAMAASAEHASVASATGPGPLALTGSPRFYLQGSHPSLLHAVSLAALALSISWCGCRWATARSSSPNRLHSVKKQHSTVDTNRAYKSLLYRFGIPYLGEIHLEARDSQPGREHEVSLPILPSRSINRWTQVARWSDGILMIWVVCFVLRYTIDPMWRDLLFRAPLAAFSCLLSGI